MKLCRKGIVPQMESVVKGDGGDFQIWVYRTVCFRFACAICPLTAARSSPRGGALERWESACREMRFLWVWHERLPLWGSSREAGERAFQREQAPALRRGNPPINPNLHISFHQHSHNAQKERPFDLSFPYALQAFYQYIPPIPPPMPPPAGASTLGSGLSATTDSVVRMTDAMEAAFCRAERVTLVGSTMPADIMST